MTEPHRKPRCGKCAHRRYQLFCEDYEALRLWCNDRCQVRQTPATSPVTSSLFIDHDWSLGWWAVRGLLCRGCNGRPSVDRYGPMNDPRVHAYLATPWWDEMARRKGWHHIGDEPVGRRIHLAPHGWILRRSDSGRWGNATVSYRKGALTWEALLRTYGPFAMSVLD